LIATRTRRVLSVQPVAERGGSDQALLALVRRLGEQGWQCHVAMPAPSPMAGEWSDAGATVHVVAMRRITTSGGLGHWLAYALEWPLVVLRLARLARSLDVDLIHTNSLHSWYGWAAARLSRRPHVWHAREIVVQSGAALWLERRMVKRFADEVIAVSAAVAAQFPEVAPDRMHVVTDEADSRRFNPGAAGTFRAGAGISDDALLVGTVGRIDTWKGLEVLLEAAGLLRAGGAGWLVAIGGLTVRGKEAYEATLRSRAEATEGVIWLGATDDVAALMADLDVFVLASTQPEPFGIVMVEALACGVPVVATAAGGPLEVLGDAPSDVGRLVPPGDSGALAAAVIDLGPRGGTSTSARRSRRSLRQASPPDYGAIFDLALTAHNRLRSPTSSK
jgi:glycosyltransferase involved in cell wall biosynthesis